jgi:hypothetical protein
MSKIAQGIFTKLDSGRIADVTYKSTVARYPGVNDY